MTTEADFSHLSRFPGETGNTFDVVLHQFEKVNRVPVPLFAVLLLLLSALPNRFSLPDSLVLWGFCLADWLLLALLPHFKRSFGPAQPPVSLLAVLRAVFALLPGPISLVLQGVGTLLVIYSFWIEPQRLTTTFQKLASSKLPNNFKLRVLHLGDLHIERLTRREEAILAEIDRLGPDLLLFSGDILNLSYRTDPTAIEQAHQFIQKWHAPLGVYLVSGSPAVDLAEILPVLLSGLPVHRLTTDKVTLQHNGAAFDLVGLTCTHRPHVDGPHLEELLPQSPERFTILLYHTPDLAPVAARLGVDLQLSGHTHGGQVRIPGFGALVTGSLYGKLYEAGRIQVKNMVLYVTRGLGLEGAAAPRLRLFCPPEMILWEITGTAETTPHF